MQFYWAQKKVLEIRVEETKEQISFTCAEESAVVQNELVTESSHLSNINET